MIRCDTFELRLIIAVKRRVCSCVGLRENITIIIILALSPDVCALALSQESSNFCKQTLQSVKHKPTFAAASPLHTATYELPSPRLYCNRLNVTCFHQYVIAKYLFWMLQTDKSFKIRLIKINLYGHNSRKVNVKVKQSRYRPERTQRVDRGIALPFRDIGARRGCVLAKRQNVKVR
jgi:hypothetical protein